MGLANADRVTGLLPGQLPGTSVAQAISQQHGGRTDKAPQRMCPEPGCNFVTNQGRARLDKHIATHSSEKPFKCMVEGCNKAFKTQELLKQHGRCHTVERNYKCPRPLCEHHESFKSQAELKLHEKRIHTLDRAEHREIKLKERCTKLEAELEAGKIDNDLLRKAVDVLQTSLKDASSSGRKRKRRSTKGPGEGEDKAEGEDGDGADDDGEEDKEEANDDDGEREGEEEGEKGAGEGGGKGGEKRKGKKPRKAYTISANNVLKAANLAATTARKATEDRVAAVKQADDARKQANEQMKAAQHARQAAEAKAAAVKRAAEAVEAKQAGIPPMNMMNLAAAPVYAGPPGTAPAPPPVAMGVRATGDKAMGAVPLMQVMATGTAASGSAAKVPIPPMPSAGLRSSPGAAKGGRGGAGGRGAGQREQPLLNVTATGGQGDAPAP